MIKEFFSKKYLISIIITSSFLATYTLKSQDQYFLIDDIQVSKRNKASCNRLGNIYDACQWISKFTIKNNGNNEITNFCLIMEVNKKNYELCYGERKSISIKRNSKKTFMINLTDSMKVSMEAEKPKIKIIPAQ